MFYSKITTVFTDLTQINRLIRSNYNPSMPVIMDDVPLMDREVILIVRSDQEFITHLNLPEDPFYEGRTYVSSFIRYQRIQK